MTLSMLMTAANLQPLTCWSEEHKRRSPDCLIFISAKEIKAKRPKGKKASTSRASRLSTISNLTVTSDTFSPDNIEAANDESIISTMAISKPSITRGGKKGVKANRSATRGKTIEKSNDEPTAASSFVEPEDDDFSVKVDHSPELTPNNRKRKSNSSRVADDNATEIGGEAVLQAPPAKRRATRSRDSVITTQNRQEEGQLGRDEDVAMTDSEKTTGGSKTNLKKGKKGGKKRAPSKPRKASMTSIASKASLRAGDLDDDEIEAALELDLDRPSMDEELDRNEGPPRKGRRLTKTKPNSKKVTASVARTRKQTRASTLPPNESMNILNQDADRLFIVGLERAAEFSFDAGLPPDSQSIEPEDRVEKAKSGVDKGAVNVNANQEDDEGVDEASLLCPSVEMPPSQQVPLTNQPKSRQGSRQMPMRNTRTSVMSISTHAVEPLELDSSMIDAQILDDDSGHETDASMVTSKRGSRRNLKKPTAAKQGKKGKKIESINPNNIDAKAVSNQTITAEEFSENQKTVETTTMDVDNQGVRQDNDPVKAKGKPRPAKSASNLKKGKKGASKAKAPVMEPSPKPLVADAPLSPPMPEAQPTPAASPQSSDAENQPPSSRPSQLRPPLTTQSPSKSRATLVPLAAETPTHSPSKNVFSKLQSKLPWAAIDLEQIFQETPGVGKENNPFASGADAIKKALTSSEKKLTVEQWIQFNAQRGEEKLRAECERLVGKFESEGMRALRTIEGIMCVE